MTYCVGLLLNEGMVMLSDTRTNAGLDNIPPIARCSPLKSRASG
jgi:predicted proteasome-type protease